MPALDVPRFEEIGGDGGLQVDEREWRDDEKTDQGGRAGESQQQQALGQAADALFTPGGQRRGRQGDGGKQSR